MADEITRWNAVLLDVIRDVGGPPGPIARGAAMMHTAMYDAVNSIAPATHKPYCVSVPAAATASIEAAIAYAARDAIVSVPAFAGGIAKFEAQLTTVINGLAPGADVDGGEAVGRACAAAMTARRVGDLADDTSPYAPGSQPGDWRPNAGATAANPNWGNVKPFCMPSGQAFRPTRPGGYASKIAMLKSKEYAAQFNEVKKLGKDRPVSAADETTQIAFFWANDLDGTYKPPGQLFEITRIVSDQRGLSLVENARLFALVALGMGDAGIVAWDSKYDTNLDLWRPDTAIHLANTDGNTSTTNDAGWTPLLKNPATGKHFTPPFPAYVSGHATFGGVHAAIMRRFFGTDNVTFTAKTNDPNLPAGTTRPFNSFTEAALENARSRVYLGVHFQWDGDNGYHSGNALGEFIFDNVLTPIGD